MDISAESLRSIASHERTHCNRPELANVIDAAADEIERLTEAIKGAAVVTNTASSEIKRLRAGIQEYLDKGCDRPGIRYKADMCPHGKFGWEACENCIDQHFKKLLDIRGDG